MFNFIRAARSLEEASKTLANGDERMAAHHLGKAENIILKTPFYNQHEIRALIALYGRRVIPPNHELSGTIPLRENCQHMQEILRQYS